jgi:phytoene desaturase
VSRVVVVGAGMGGLAVAARLAAQRHQVVVVEQAATFGGKLAAARRDGFVFDTGPSLLTLPAGYRDFFLKTAVRRAGAGLDDNVELVEVQPAFAYCFADGTTVELATSSRTATSQSLDAALGPGRGQQWTALVDYASEVWAVTRTAFLTQPLDGPAVLRRALLRPGDLRAVAPLTSLRTLGRQRFSDDRLVQMLDRYATYQGSDPRRAPAALCVIPYIERTFGTWHVQGGLYQLAVALHARCLELGVVFRFDTDVAAVMLQAGRAAGVRLTDGEQVHCDVVVSDADARHLYQDLLAPAVAARPLAALRKATPSLSAFTIQLAVRGRTPGMRHHTVLFPADYDAEFDAIFGRRPQPVEDPAVYLCVPDDAAMRPDDGHEPWTVLVNAPRHEPARPDGRGVDWRAPGLADSYADHVLAVLAARGVHTAGRVLWRQVLTPADLQDQARAPGGAIYGSSSNGPRAGFLRPRNRSPVPGLFLVGGSAHPGGGLPLVGLSAEIVAGMVGQG